MRVPAVVSSRKHDWPSQVSLPIDVAGGPRHGAPAPAASSPDRTSASDRTMSDREPRAGGGASTCDRIIALADAGFLEPGRAAALVCADARPQRASLDDFGVCGRLDHRAAWRPFWRPACGAGGSIEISTRRCRARSAAPPGPWARPRATRSCRRPTSSSSTPTPRWWRRAPAPATQVRTNRLILNVPKAPGDYLLSGGLNETFFVRRGHRLQLHRHVRAASSSSQVTATMLSGGGALRVRRQQRGRRAVPGSDLPALTPPAAADGVYLRVDVRGGSSRSG